MIARIKLFTVLVFTVSCWQNVVAQLVDSTKYKQVQYLKLNNTNDMFTVLYQSDKNYSDGLNIELSLGIFNNKVSDFLLLGFKRSPYKDFALGINQDIFTPEDYSISEVDSSDRPYSGQLYFEYIKNSNRFLKGQKLISTAYIGIQGPAALGKEVQNGVHALIKNDPAQGWDNQLSNGLILDYQLQYLQLIPVSSSFTELHYFGKARLGLLNTSAEVGLRFKIGRYTDSYMNYYGIANSKNRYEFTSADISKMSSSRRKAIPKRIRKQGLEAQANYFSEKLNRKFQLYIFTEVSAAYVLRNGSVEGSLVQFEPNKYEYGYDDYEHFLVGGRYGVVLQYSHFYMEFARYLHNDAIEENGFFGYGKLILTWVF